MAVVISGPDTGEAAPPLIHNQVVAATVWGPIEHNLGYRPAAVSLFSDDYGQQYDEYTVQHLDENTLRVAMDQPATGIALIAR